MGRSSLLNGTIKSCGCFRRERAAALNHVHGGKGTPEFKAWDSIKQRCLNPKNKSWSRYGGRGIAICDEWRDDFARFCADMGPRPTPRHSVERINRDGNYEPGNCRWATLVEQARNRSNNMAVQWEGREMALSEAAELAGLPYKSVRSRVQKGWTAHKALSTPVNKAKVDAAIRGLGKPSGDAG